MNWLPLKHLALFLNKFSENFLYYLRKEYHLYKKHLYIFRILNIFTNLFKLKALEIDSGEKIMWSETSLVIFKKLKVI